LMRVARLGAAVAVPLLTPEPASCNEFSLALEAERTRDLERAAHMHAAAAKRCPNDGRARYSEVRADFLVTHAEGDYAPLTLLERAQASEPGALQQLSAAVANFPPGLVAQDARLLLGQTALRDPRAGDAGLQWLRTLVLDANVTREHRDDAARLWLDYTRARGGLLRAWDARAALRGVPTYGAIAARLAMRETLAAGCYVIIGLYVIALCIQLRTAPNTSGAIHNVTRRRVTRTLTAYALAVGLGLPAVLWALGAQLNPRPFFALGAFVWLIAGVGHRLARRAGGWQRRALSWLAAGVVAAGAYLALHHIEPGYLEGFGL
jgi:hypothetical protein